jgi:uncharacterized membrane protein YgcG
MFCTLPVAALAFVASTSVMQVPDPRPAHHVVDLTGTLDNEDIAAIDRAAQKASSNGELVVVVVASTDGVVPRDWATAYFNRLRLDTKERNRGVVLMAAIGDRKAEIVVGDGFPALVTNDTDAIMQSVVVANFKRGDARAALVQGAQHIADHVIGAPAAGAAGAAAAAALAKPAPVVSGEVIAASGDARVLALVGERAGRLLIDDAQIFKKGEVESVAAQQSMMSEDMTLIVVTVRDTAPLSRSTFAHGLAHRLGLHDTSARTSRDVLVVVGSGVPKPSKGKKPKATAPSTGPSIDIVLGAALPADVHDLGRTTNEWRVRVDKGMSLSESTLATLSELKFLPMAVAMAEAEAKRAAAAAAQEQESNAAWRAQLAASAAEQEARDQNAFLRDDNPLAWGAGGAGLLGIVFAGREVMRRRPRSCKQCKVPMRRLGEELDDQHLKDGEKAEERLGSVDYDIWSCAQCGSVLKTRWGAIFTSYSKCGSCSWKTMKSTSRTITAATTSSTGLAEVTESCQHCSHHRTYTRVIPRVQQSSSSSSGGRSGGGGFSSGRGSSGSW